MRSAQPLLLKKTAGDKTCTPEVLEALKSNIIELIIMPSELYYSRRGRSVGGECLCARGEIDGTRQF